MVGRKKQQKGKWKDKVRERMGAGSRLPFPGSGPRWARSASPRGREGGGGQGALTLSVDSYEVGRRTFCSLGEKPGHVCSRGWW